MVASAAEEMKATVDDISGNTANTRFITEEAVTKTDTASQRVNQLGGPALEISKVTEVITEQSITGDCYWSRSWSRTGGNCHYPSKRQTSISHLRSGQICSDISDSLNF